MDIIVEFSVFIITCLIWMALVVLFLRLFKIDPLHRGRAFFVFFKGVVVWGWSMFLGMTALHYVAVKYFHGSSTQISPPVLAIGFVVYSVIGILIGLTQRGRKISVDSNPSHLM